jgi:hypothetical protein
MTDTCLQPTNLNPLSPNGFQFSIQKLPELTFFAQQVSIPGISLPNAVYDTPFVQIKVPGTLLTYETLNVEFIVDENMSNYLAIADWMLALGFPENYQQYISWQSKDKTPFLSELAKNSSDATLEILGSNNKPIQTVTFVDLIPTSLGAISFITTSNDVQYITCSVSFEYSYYKFQ